jgi:hypothetical protein
MYLANIRCTQPSAADNQVKCKRSFYQQQLKRAVVTPLRSTSHVEKLPAN